MGFLQRLTGGRATGPGGPLRVARDAAPGPADLDASIARAERALAQAGSDRDRRDLQDQLGCCYLDRHRAQGSAADLDRSLDLLEVSGGGWSSDRPVHLPANLALALHERWQERGDARDLDRAVMLMEPLVAQVPAPGQGVSLSAATTLLNAGLFLSNRFRLRGHLDDQDRAVELTRSSVALVPPGHPMRIMGTTNLAARHLHLFEARGDEADGQTAVRLFREVLAATPTSSPEHATRQANLGSALAGVARALRRAGRSREAVPLAAESLIHLRTALTGRGEARFRAVAAVGLGACLLEQHLLTLELGGRPASGLDEAIEAFTDSRAGLNGPDQVEAEVGLSLALLARSEDTSATDPGADRAAALALASSAQARTPLTGIRRAEINELLTILEE